MLCLQSPNKLVCFRKLGGQIGSDLIWQKLRTSIKSALSLLLISESMIMNFFYSNNTQYHH